MAAMIVRTISGVRTETCRRMPSQTLTVARRCIPTMMGVAANVITVAGTDAIACARSNTRTGAGTDAITYWPLYLTLLRRSLHLPLLLRRSLHLWSLLLRPLDLRTPLLLSSLLLGRKRGCLP